MNKDWTIESRERRITRMDHERRRRRDGRGKERIWRYNGKGVSTLAPLLMPPLLGMNTDVAFVATIAEAEGGRSEKE